MKQKITKQYSHLFINLKVFRAQIAQQFMTAKDFL